MIAYAAGHEDEAYVSCAGRDFTDFPPTLLLRRKRRFLLSDAKTVFKKTKAGVESKLIVEEGMCIVYPL
ncbi:MAG: hypothetical protein R2912_07890 [Eubacteriales bacterium]